VEEESTHKKKEIKTKQRWVSHFLEVAGPASPSLRIIPGMNFLPPMVKFLVFSVTFLAELDFVVLNEKKKKVRAHCEWKK